MTDVSRVLGLASGQIAPATGMEIHFLKVVAGTALPCSPEEQEWFEEWKREVSRQENQSETQALTDQLQRQQIEIVALRKEIEALTQRLAKLSPEELARIAEAERKALAKERRKQRIEYEKRDEFAKRLAAEKSGAIIWKSSCVERH